MLDHATSIVINPRSVFFGGSGNGMWSERLVMGNDLHYLIQVILWDLTGFMF